MHNVYVASSWRNRRQPSTVARLRMEGFTVYDFRNPPKKGTVFHWSEIDPLWKSWTTKAFSAALERPIAKAGFRSDFEALQKADAVVLVLPCGKSAHLEAGFAAGMGKPVFIYAPEPPEPELMYELCKGIYDDIDELIVALRAVEDQIWVATLPGVLSLDILLSLLLSNPETP